MFDYRKYKTHKEALDDLQAQSPGVPRSNIEKQLYNTIPKESKFQSDIIKWIKKNYPKAFVWKAAAGSYSRCGIPDICCVIDGQYYGFEVKRPLIGKATAIQIKTLEQIKVAGGVAEIVSYIEDVERIIKKSRKENLG